jgi:putative membrane protein
MCVASGLTLVIMSVIAGWCFLGLEALISDVGGVFGHSGMSPLLLLDLDLAD